MTEIDITKPKWDQSTFFGRMMYFTVVTSPTKIFHTNQELNWAKDIVTRYRRGERIDIPEAELWKAKHLYESAFHPDSGEKMQLIGRMSAQVPTNMFLTGAMQTFAKTTPQIIFWQWSNQTYTAIVNYTNRSGNAPISMLRLGTSYVLATTGALGIALGLRHTVKWAPRIVKRIVPSVAVSAAICVNVPTMRSNELRDGIPVHDSKGRQIGNSVIAAKWAITQVVISRILQASPGMVVPAYIMSRVEKRWFMRRWPWISIPIQTFVSGFIFLFSTPLSCALFPQDSPIEIVKLEKEIQKNSLKMKVEDKVLFYNKGL